MPDRPRIGLAVAVVAERLSTLHALLGDVAAQSETAGSVNVVCQRSDAHDASRLGGELRERFPTVDIRVTANPRIGLSEARNLVLDGCEDDILLLADDDSRLDPHAVRSIADAFEKHPDATVVAFRATWTGGDRRINYPTATRRLSSRASVRHVVSIEIAMHVAALEGLGVRFDERFGPGARFATGEEFIFLTDVLRSGAQVYYEPIAIASHPALSSGRRKLDREVLSAKGAMFARTYGALGLLTAPMFVLRKSLQGELRVDPVRGVVSVIRGFREMRS